MSGVRGTSRGHNGSSHAAAWVRRNKSENDLSAAHQDSKDDFGRDRPPRVPKLDLTQLQSPRPGLLGRALRRGGIKSETHMVRHERCECDDSDSDSSSASSSALQIKEGTAHATAQPLRQVKSDNELDELLRKYEDLLDSRDALFHCEPGDRKMSLNTREGPRAAWRALPEFGPSTGLTSESENPLAASPTGRRSSPYAWVDAIQVVAAPGMRLLKYLRGR